ncbi:MAG TPA: Hpt domain-containing protein [Gemmatimonadales bacterium]|jgi:HPt (histidine-containing phosphotransfer) domain-containing protein|nr:Hpt domain-containing protein [Gemmatimonadales bacterium]
MTADEATPDALSARLMAQYREHLPTAVASLEEGLELYRRAPGEGAAVVRRLAHQLAGSGGSYGFPEITARAREAEHAPEPGLRRATERLIALLRDLASPLP